VCTVSGLTTTCGCSLRIRELNPNVEVTVVAKSLSDANTTDKQWAAFFKDFAVVVASDCDAATELRLSGFCREGSREGEESHGPVCIVARSMGFYSFFHVDVGSGFSYLKKAPKGKKEAEAAGKSEEKAQEHRAVGVALADVVKTGFAAGKKALGRRLRSHCSLLFATLLLYRYEAKYGQPKFPADAAKLLALRDEMCAAAGMEGKKVLPRELLEQTLGQLGVGLSPVLSIVGGVLSQEVLKLVSRKGCPIDNLVLYDAHHGGAYEVKLGGSGQNKSGKRDATAGKKRKPVEDISLVD
jgi:ubiquitin-like 1-activating enzyme E1 A